MSKVRQLTLNPLMTEKQANELAGVHLDLSYVHHLVEEDCDLTCGETGKTLARFRKKVIPQGTQANAFKSLRTAAAVSVNRGISAGWDEEAVKDYVKRAGAASYERQGPDSNRFWLILKDGTRSNTSYAVPTESGVVGYMDRNPRFPMCRLTAFTQKHFDKFRKAYGIVKLVDRKYEELMPEHYKLQREIADRTHPDFVIKNTAFTTVTVNKNWQTAVHKDAGDFKEGFGNLVALRHGRFKGGYFCLPRWGAAFDLQNGDLLMADVHEWHGNTPIEKVDPWAIRLSLVMYYRENMIHCGSAEEELHRSKNREKGGKING